MNLAILLALVQGNRISSSAVFTLYRHQNASNGCIEFPTTIGEWGATNTMDVVVKRSVETPCWCKLFHQIPIKIPLSVESRPPTPLWPNSTRYGWQKVWHSIGTPISALLYQRPYRVFVCRSLLPHGRLVQNLTGFESNSSKVAA